MAPIRRSNRARKPRDYWDPTNSPPHRRQPPAFTIYTESSEDLDSELSDEDLNSELDEDLSLKLDKNLSKLLSRQLYENLDMNSSYQLQFLFKNRADKFQNFQKDSNSLKLF